MFVNIFKLIFRNLYQYKYYTLVNILGLSIGLAALVWAWQTYRFSFSYDRFHQDREKIFRILSKIEGREIKMGICPLPLGLMAKSDLSAVSDYVRLENVNLSLKAGQEEALNSRVTYTDPAFFDFFNFPLVAGVHDIGDRSGILLTETSAKKIFGAKEVLGQTVILHAGEPYQQPLKVTGVLKDPPINSSIQFNAFYQNEIAAEAQRVNASVATIFFWFAIISALLTATGLFALISLTILKKLREIAIRRVVGASTGNIVFIVNKSYILVFVFSLVLGVFAGIALTRLLMDLIFVVNVGVHGPTLVYSIAGILLLVALTLGIKILHTLSLKPSEVLRANQ